MKLPQIVDKHELVIGLVFTAVGTTALYFHSFDTKFTAFFWATIYLGVISLLSSTAFTQYQLNLANWEQRLEEKNEELFNENDRLLDRNQALLDQLQEMQFRLADAQEKIEEAAL